MPSIPSRAATESRVIYRFDGFELDVARRELRLHGASRPLQPRALAVPACLVCYRDRVVPKRELLERLGPMSPLRTQVCACSGSEVEVYYG